MNINLHIDRLVLDGVTICSKKQPAFQAAVETELTWLLTTEEWQDNWLSGGTLYRVAAPEIDISHDTGPAQLGELVARAAYGAINIMSDKATVRTEAPNNTSTTSASAGTLLQRKSKSSIVHDVLNSPGEALEIRTRSNMESKFNHDFCHVRVHSVGNAFESARSPIVGSKSPEEVREAAAKGVQGIGRELPYLEAIQASFGHHDVTNVQAHLGGSAEIAAATIRATAYTIGNHVAFSETPDLRTSAHEAAHVVQQRAGLQFRDGIGQIGDVYERSADAVADAVSQGRSAQELLDSVTRQRAPNHPRLDVLQGCWIKMMGQEAFFDADHPLAQLFFRQYPSYAPTAIPQPINVLIRAVEGAEGVRYLAYDTTSGFNVEIGEVTGYQTPEQWQSQSQQPPEGSIASLVSEATGGRATLSEVYMDFIFPERTVLSEDPQLVAMDSCQAQVSVDPNWITISFSPPLRLSTAVIGEDVLVSRVTWWFERASPEVILTRVPSTLGIDFSARARRGLEDWLRLLFNATVFSQPGYDPFADENLMANVSRLGESFGSGTTTTQESEAEPAEEPVDGGGIRATRIGATLEASSFRHEITRRDVLEIPEGAIVTIEIEGQGDLAQMIANAQSGDVEGLLRTGRIDHVDMRSDQINVFRDGQQIYNLSHLRWLWREHRFEFVESTWIEGAGEPETVGEALVDVGLALEEWLGPGLTIFLGVLIRENRNAIPGVDLLDLFLLDVPETHWLRELEL